MPSADFLFHDLLRLRINHDGGLFVAPLLAKYAAYRTEAEGQADLTVNLRRFEIDKRDAYRLDGYWFVKEGEIACEHRYKIARWKVRIRGMESDRTEVDIDANLPGRVVMAGDTVPSLLRYKLARKGALLLHGSAAEKDGVAVIFNGRSGAGKTITAARLARSGYRFLGDDACLFSRGEALSFLQPFNVRFTYDVKGVFGNPFTAGDRLRIFAKRLLSLATLGRISLLTSLPAERVFGRALGRGGRCGTFVILQGGEALEIERDYPPRAAVDQAMLNLRFECRELDGYLKAYSHVFPRSGLGGFWESRAAALAEGLSGVRILKVTVPRVYTEADFAAVLGEIQGAAVPAAEARL